MKKIILCILLLASVVSIAQKKPKIKGSKTVIEVTNELPPFNAIKIADDLRIELKKARENSYTFIGDDNLLDVLKFEVTDSILEISSFYRIVSRKKLVLTVNYIGLNGVTMLDGRLDMKDIVTTDYLDINLQGSSKLNLNTLADIVTISMSGNSNAELNVDCDELVISQDQKSNLGLYLVAKITKVTMHGNADSKLEGAATDLQINLFGNSQLRAESLKGAAVSANLDESPDARIYATDNFELSSKGGSKTYLYGTPKITIIDFLNSSQLIKKE